MYRARSERVRCKQIAAEERAYKFSDCDREEGEVGVEWRLYNAQFVRWPGVIWRGGHRETAAAEIVVAGAALEVSIRRKAGLTTVADIGGEAGMGLRDQAVAGRADTPLI